VRLHVPLRLFGWILALAPLTGIAAPSSYTGSAPVNSQSDDERVGALKTALANVVIEQAGDPGVVARPEVAKAVEKAERYMLQYSYRRNTGGDYRILTINSGNVVISSVTIANGRRQMAQQERRLREAVAQAEGFFIRTAVSCLNL